MTKRLTWTYGLRWDVDFAPSTLNGPSIPAVTGYSLEDFSRLALAPPGTAPFHTKYGNVAPRIGAAYQMVQKADWQTVLRGGFGVFYDLVSSEAGNIIGAAPPFQNLKFNSNEPYPWDASLIAPSPIPPTGTITNLAAFNPNLKAPYTLEWNASVEQGIGKDQLLSISYIGAAGRNLMQTTEVIEPPSNPELFGILADSLASSSYNALQAQFQRRLSRGLQVLSSYTWSHSIDDASAGSYGVGSNLGSSGNMNMNRASSDFDIRHAFTAGLTYQVPTPETSRWLKAILQGWSTENFVTARSAPPVTVTDVNFFRLDAGFDIAIRPDVVPGQPFYLYGSQYPGGKAFNPAAFQNPPASPVTGNPARQGDFPRNGLRTFGATQWDFAVHRDFPLWERWKLQFRAELFNVLNHPNFGTPSSQFGAGGFGIATSTLAQSLANGSLGSGGFDPLYQIGGPRSVQLALKLFF
jgi:hypothetical protein